MKNSVPQSTNSNVELLRYVLDTPDHNFCVCEPIFKIYFYRSNNVRRLTNKSATQFKKQLMKTNAQLSKKKSVKLNT